MANDSQKTPSGYDVPPDLSAGKKSRPAPVPSGYDAPPDLTKSNAPSSIPVPSGYSVPELGELGDTPVVNSPQKAMEPQAVDAPGGFKMKSMGQEFIDGEKNQPGRQVESDGRSVEVREKEWLRQKTNEDRAARGLEPISPERWEEEKIANTEYMGTERAAQHQVGFEEGVDANGQSNAKLTGESVRGDGKHIFVMDGEGEVFAKEVKEAHAQKDQTDRGVHVHHSSFKSGEAVAGAGEISVDDQGFVKEVTDRSGHYRPGEEQTAQTLEHLEQAKGVNLDNTKFTRDRSDEKKVDKTTGMAREYLQGQVSQEEIDHRQAKIEGGADIKAKPEGQAEQTFVNRHNVANELKQQTSSVRATLDKDAERRATRVRKTGEHLEAGMKYEKVSPAAQAHAAKDETKLKSEYKESFRRSVFNPSQPPDMMTKDISDQMGFESDAYTLKRDDQPAQDLKQDQNALDAGDDAKAKAPSVRDSLGKSLGSRQSQGSNGMKLK